MFDYKIKKQISGKTFNSLDSTLNMESFKASLCNEILKFAEDNSLNGVDVVVKFKELMDNHLDELKSNWEELDGIADNLCQMNLNDIDKPEIVINEKHIFIRSIKDTYEFLYETGFDKYYRLFGYGQILIEKRSRKNDIIDKRLVFSNSEQLLKIFNVEQFIKLLTERVSQSESFKKLTQEFDEVKQELFTVLGVDRTELRSLEDCNFEKIYSYQPHELLVRLHHARIDRAVTLALIKHGFKETNDNLVKLVLVERRIRFFNRNREEEIELFGEEEYNKICEKNLMEKNELNSSLNVSDGHLRNIVNDVYNYLDKDKSKQI